MMKNSLDFSEDNIYIGAGDILAIRDFAVFAQLSPVFPIQLLPSGFGVTMNSKLLKRAQKLVHVCAFCHIGYSV